MPRTPTSWEPLITGPPKGSARTLARRLGLVIVIYVYDRKGGAIWMFRYKGVEVGSWIPRTGWCRALHLWQQRRTALEAVKMVAKAVGALDGEQTKRRAA